MWPFSDKKKNNLATMNIFKHEDDIRRSECMDDEVVVVDGGGFKFVTFRNTSVRLDDVSVIEIVSMGCPPRISDYANIPIPAYDGEIKLLVNGQNVFLYTHRDCVTSVFNEIIRVWQQPYI